jgi:two-component system sensor histidine kinase/response regulator
MNTTANGPKILCVDDDPMNLALLEAVLVPQGYETILVESYGAALESTSADPPDLILLDVKMPGVSGYEICKKLKTSSATKSIPVILITSLSGTEERIKGIDAGADDFISKPFDKNELLARVRSLLKIKALHDELESSYGKLKDLERLKDNLTHMIVHDMNNPLAILYGNLKLIEMSAGNSFSDEQNSKLKAAFRSMGVLQGMIADLLDIIMMEECKMTLKYEGFSLKDVIAGVIDQAKVESDLQDKVLVMEAVEGLPEVSADLKLIKRVIGNLVNNAINFTPAKGTITVKAAHNGLGGDLSVQVKDTGDGIPKEYLYKIFDKFSQMKTKQARIGHGLGLTFCKMAVEAHGGKIWAESEIGKGSVFCFTLPLKYGGSMTGEKANNPM